MAVAQSNRLLPIIAGVVGLMAVFVLLRACGGPEDSVQLRDVPQAPAPDADSPAETIRTLSAQVADMSSTFEVLRTENETLRREQERRERQLDRDVARRVQDELARHGDEPARGLEGVMERIDRLSGRVEDLSARPRPPTEFEIPIGLGLEDGEGPNGAQNMRPQAVERIQWIHPVGWEEDTASTPRRRVLGDVRLPDLPSAARVSASEPVGRTTQVARATQAAARALPGVRPGEATQAVYTVPRNATLIGSTAMTALIGRIPRRGTVEDPMHFKIIQGRDNLAANGLTIPGIEGMVWSGTATGDWTLGCVRGRLDSVTFVFEDGTIRTLPDHDPSAGPGETKDGTGDTKPLGWISDERGYPCISGKRITNAPQFLASRAALIGLQAAADAVAAGETTTTIASDGTRIGTITGDQARYIAGRAIGGGSEEVVRWLVERQEQSFDAVVTPAGIPVTLHTDRELRIDYVPEPTGRRLTHETDRDYRSVRLD